MVSNQLPDVPDPTKIANSVAEGAKIVADQVAVVGQAVVEGFGKVVVTSTKGAIASADHVAKDIISGVEANISTVRATGETVKRALQSTAEGLRSQVDAGIGGEVVRKLQKEIEKVAR